MAVVTLWPWVEWKSEGLGADNFNSSSLYQQIQIDFDDDDAYDADDGDDDDDDDTLR